MRTSVALLIALLALGCVRLNPAYGDEETQSATGGTDETGTTTSSTGAAEASSAAGTGTPTDLHRPTLACEEAPFEIALSSDALDCVTVLESGGLARQCVALTEWGGNRLKGSFASGCEQGMCLPSTVERFEFGVKDLDLPSLFGELGSDDVRCAWVRLDAAIDDTGSCEYTRLEVWETPGVLRVAVGNGPPDDAGELRPPFANPIEISTAIVADTSCGDAAPCSRSGYRSIRVGFGDDAAQPDGVPALTRLSPDPADTNVYATFNWGLQVDLHCREWGRWAVLPEADVTLFD